MFRSLLINLGALAIYILPLVFGAWVVIFYFDYNILQAPNPKSTQTILFEVKKGTSREKISHQLEKKGLIRSWRSIYYLSNIKKGKGGVKAIMEGEYELSPSQTPKEIIETLFSGKTVAHPIVIPPGVTVKEAAKLLAKSGLVTETQAFDALRDQHLMRSLGVPAYIPEGYLIERSYDFARPITAKEIVGTIVEMGKQEIEQKIPNWTTRADELGLRPYQVMTLASIIEKEAENESERANISAVYHNRLRIGMHLKSSIALKYGLPDNADPTEEDMKAPGPYNTFVNTGLPPSPICSPSIESVRATLYPADTDYLYFLKSPDGEFLYASTYKQHKKNLKKLGMAEAAS